MGKQAIREIGPILWCGFWRLIAPLTPHRSILGRMIRTRGCHRPRPTPQLQADVARAQAIVDTFDSETDVLVFGSSHALHAVNPECARTLKFWNASFVSGDAMMDYYAYMGLRKRWPQREGQCVLLNEDFWLGMLQTEYTIYFAQITILHEVMSMPYRCRWLMWPYERVVRKLLATNLPAVSKRGYVRSLGENGKTAQERCLGHIKFLKHRPTELAWLEKLRAQVEADGRHLIFFRTPLDDDYRKVFETFRERAWAICSKVRAGLPVLDYSATLPPSERCFADADHLSPEGACWFTPLLESDLLALGFQTKEVQTCPAFSKIQDKSVDGSATL